ncbi:MAG: hypothetical protein RLY14_1248 [Planctomycetota bacterium]|jgi:hypothetical protein
MSQLPPYEKLGSFYLGKKYDLATKSVSDELTMYDAKDLTTHALCVGMTGSGKTGLCLALLEEAAIDGIPAIIVDPKGDLGNLLLTFPKLQPQDFEPWVDPGEATRAGLTPSQYAEQTAQRWKDGLAKWDQTPDRISRFKESVDIAIYTPGSNAGIPITVLRSFDAPEPEVIEDAETFRERINSSVSGLLTLLGINADPLSSQEHILLANIMDKAWRAGQNLSLPELIRQIQSPPFQRVGMLELNAFMSADARAKLANSLNNLLASPTFASWLEGEPLEIKNLLYAPDGRPRLSILSIAHLNDSERMFFVTLLLGELLSWMRSQPGTSSLRAIFYMDEVFGYFPPSAKPPSKQPMLTLLKQARAFGLGIVLATQNPVDLDYKGLSNMGTWFLGRLQTDRDKQRVLDGLEGAALQSGSQFDRAKMDQMLSAMGNRVFLMNNVHDDAPTVFQTRWALSYLRGPLSRQQIQTLMRSRLTTSPTNSANSTESSPTSSSDSSSARPILPNDITELFWVPSRIAKNAAKIVYRPAILGQASQHFVKATNKIDLWQDYTLCTHLNTELAEDPWELSETILDGELQLATQPDSGIQFASLPDGVASSATFKKLDTLLKNYLYRHEVLTLYYSKALGRTSSPGQSETDFRVSLDIAAREVRDLEIEKLKTKYSSKMQTLKNRLLTAEQRVQQKEQEAKRVKMETFLNLGTSLLGAVLGNKLASRTNLSKAGTAAKSFGRQAQKQSDVARAEESLESIQKQYDELEQQFRSEVDEVESKVNSHNLELEAIEIPSRKTDIRLKRLALIWIPWQVDATGIATPLVEIPS